MNNRTRLTRALLATAVVAASTATAVIGGAAPASAQGTPTLTVSPSTVPTSGTTWVTVDGTNFLAPPGKTSGGVYVLFGAIRTANWGPSWRGRVASDPYAGYMGSTYAYGGTADYQTTTDDGSGFTRFVAFSNAGVDRNATAYFMEISGNRGSFPANKPTLRIDSPIIAYVDTAKVARTIDCRNPGEWKCGVFTIGAHGFPEPSNELFFPISFSNTAPAPTPSAPAPAGGGSTITPGGSTGTGGSTGSVGSTNNNSGSRGNSAATPNTLSPDQQALVKAIAEQQEAEAAAAAAAAAAETTTIPDEVAVAAETTAVDEASDTSSTTSTTKPKSTSEVAKGAETVTVGDDDGGSNGLVIGLAVGIPVIAAAGAVAWRKKNAAA